MLRLLQRRTDAINRRDATALGAVYALDCQVESPLAAGLVHGRHALTKVNQALFTAFPDVEFHPDIITVDGSTMTASGWLTGTYTGGFMGLPPSGKPIRVPIAIISKVVDGEIAFERRVYDFTGMLVQAGMLRAVSH